MRVLFMKQSTVLPVFFWTELLGPPVRLKKKNMKKTSTFR